MSQFIFGPATGQIKEMEGATSSANGTSGLVPAPQAGDEAKYLKGDGTFGTVDLSSKLDSSLKGSANGVAELDANGKVPSAQLPSYVDDVEEYASLSNFPATGESGKIYIAKDTNITYRWGGSSYVAIGSDLALGETSSTAYRGDRGAAAYAAAVTNVESSPSSGSSNLITSGGVYTALGNLGNKLDKNYEYNSDNFISVTFSGLTSFYGQRVWTDGNNVYYSYGSDQYVLDKSTLTWSSKSWTGLTNFTSQYIWTDGTNIYYSSSYSQYVLNKTTSTWSSKSWDGFSSFDGDCVWTDGENIYLSDNSNQYVLNTSTSTWNTKTWTGLTSFSGQYIWTDGDNIYYGAASNHYVLDKSTSTWSTKIWTGLSSFDANYFSSSNVWTDGNNIYYSNGSNQYVLDKSASNWNEKAWVGEFDSFIGQYIWTDGNNIYYSYNGNNYQYNDAVEPKIYLGFHGEFSTAPYTNIPGLLPSVASSDNDKVLKVVNGKWAAATASSGLPAVTSSDNGKFLQVVNGAWAAATIPNANGVSF